LFYETFGLRSNVAGVTCIYINKRHGALAHPARLRMLAAARREAALFPNYFG